MTARSRVAVTSAAEITWYVDTSFTVRGLRADTDFCFRVIAENGAPLPLTLDRSFVPRTSYDRPSAPRGPLEVSDVTRSSVTLSWLAPTSNGGAAIVAYVIGYGRQPGRGDRLPIPRLHRKRRDLSDRRSARPFSQPTVGVTLLSVTSCSKTRRSTRFGLSTKQGHGDSQNSTSPVVQSLCTMLAATFSFRFG